MTLEKFREGLARITNRNSEIVTIIHHLEEDRITEVSVIGSHGSQNSFSEPLNVPFSPMCMPISPAWVKSDEATVNAFAPEMSCKQKTGACPMPRVLNLFVHRLVTSR